MHNRNLTISFCDDLTLHDAGILFKLCAELKSDLYFNEKLVAHYDMPKMDDYPTFTPATALERIKSMQVAQALEWALDWRSDDFGHDCMALLEAESMAFAYFGELMRKLL